MVGFIRAVDDEVERRESVEFADGNAERARLLAGAFGGGRANDLQSGAHAFGEEIQKGVGRAAGAETELHAVADVIERACGSGALQGIRVVRGEHRGGLAYPAANEPGPLGAQAVGVGVGETTNGHRIGPV